MQIEPLDIIGIQQREETFWRQLNGSIDYGLSYTSGNSMLSSSLGAAVEYQRTKDLVRLTTSSQFDTQSIGPSTNRYTFDGQLFPAALGAVVLRRVARPFETRSAEARFAGHDRRCFGRTMVRTERTSFRIFAGTVFSREHYFPQMQTTAMRENREALIGANFYTFKVLDIRSSLLASPEPIRPGTSARQLRLQPPH